MFIPVPLIFLVLSIVVMLSVKIFLLSRKLHRKNSLLVKQDKYAQTGAEDEKYIWRTTWKSKQ